MSAKKSGVSAASLPEGADPDLAIEASGGPESEAGAEAEATKSEGPSPGEVLDKSMSDQGFNDNQKSFIMDLFGKMVERFQSALAIRPGPGPSKPKGPVTTVKPSADAVLTTKSDKELVTVQLTGKGPLGGHYHAKHFDLVGEGEHKLPKKFAKYLLESHPKDFVGVKSKASDDDGE